MKYGKFNDYWRGNGFFLSVWCFTFAFRKKWHFYICHVTAKPGYTRWYIGPIEIEFRKPAL